MHIYVTSWGWVKNVWVKFNVWGTILTKYIAQKKMSNEKYIKIYTSILSNVFVY